MKPLFRLLEKDFSLVEHVTLFERLFLLAKTDAMSGNQFLNSENVFLSAFWLEETHFLASGNQFFSHF